LESKNLVEDSRLVVDLISMPSGPSAFESIAMPNDWMRKQNCMGGFEGSTHPEFKNMGPSPHVVSPLAFL